MVCSPGRDGGCSAEMIFSRGAGAAAASLPAARLPLVFDVLLMQLVPPLLAEGDARALLLRPLQVPLCLRHQRRVGSRLPQRRPRRARAHSDVGR